MSDLNYTKIVRKTGWLELCTALLALIQSVQNCSLPYLWKGVGPCPFPCGCSAIITFYLQVFINPTTIYPITTNLIVQWKVVPACVAVDWAKWPQVMSALSINAVTDGICLLCLWSESWFDIDGDLCVCSEVCAGFMWGRCVPSSDTLVRHSLKRKCLPNAEQASWPPTKEKSLMQWKKTLISEHHILCFQAAELWSEQVMTRTNLESHIPSKIRLSLS